MGDKPSDLVQGTLDVLILKNVGAGSYAWIWDFRANRTDK